GVSSCFFFPKGFSSKSSIFDLFGSLIRTLSCRVYLFFSFIVWQHQVLNAMYPSHYSALLFVIYFWIHSSLKAFCFFFSFFDFCDYFFIALSCRFFLFFSLIVWQHQVRNAMYPYHYPALLEGPY